MPEVRRPTISEARFDITDYGAKGDGETDCTKAIQAAIDAAAQAGGGRVVVPTSRFLCGPILLQSKIDLHFEDGAMLLMSRSLGDYPVENGSRRNFITAKDAHDVRISGRGIIDGQGQPWWEAYLRVKGTGTDEPRRPQLICIENCDTVELTGFTTINPPNTHCSVRKSRSVTVDGVTMTAPDESPNTDGLNFNTSTDVLVVNCNISTGDDNVALVCNLPVEGAGPGMRNVTVRDCQFGVGHGMSIGSYTVGGVENVCVENVKFDGTTSGIRMKSDRDRGGPVAKLTYRNLTLQKVRFPLFISSHYPRLPANPAEKASAVGERVPSWRDILIENVTMTDCKNAAIVWGLPDKRITGLKLSKVKVSAEQGAAVFFADAVFTDVEIVPKAGAPLVTYEATVEGMKSAPFEGEFRVAK